MVNNPIMKHNIKKQNIIELIIALAILLLLNYISSTIYFRLDLTTDKRYTLSETTHQILDSLYDMVYIEIYLDGDMPIGFQRMKKAIKEQLDEFRVIAGDNIQYNFFNPSETDDPAKRNALYQDIYDRGIIPTNVKDKDEEGGLSEKILFPGAMVIYKGFETPVNFLHNNPMLSADENLNNSVQGIEFELIDGIRKITTEKRKRIAFIEGQGELNEYYTSDITKALSEYYEIDRVTIKDYLQILNPYKAIIIAGPTEQYTEKSKFIIDQYIMNGGKVLWFIESVKVDMDSLSTGSYTFATLNDANLNDQLFKYSVRVNPNVIQDIQCSIIPVNTAPAGQQAKFSPAPWLYSPLLTPPNNNPITKNLNLIKSEFPSVIDIVGNNQEIKKQVILASSANSKTINAPLLVSLNQVKDKLEPETFNQSFNPIAVLLEGNFESVFKNRMLSSYTNGEAFDFKEVSVPTEMIVISDADIIRNDVRMRADGIFISPLGYDRYSKQTYGNKEFVLNAVQYLVDGKSILDIRSREFKLRLLDKAKIKTEKTKWQLINTLLPILIIIIFAILMNFLRKRRYTR